MMAVLVKIWFLLLCSNVRMLRKVNVLCRRSHVHQNQWLCYVRTSNLMILFGSALTHSIFAFLVSIPLSTYEVSV